MALPAYLMDKSLEKRIVTLEEVVKWLQKRILKMEKEMKIINKRNLPPPPKSKRSPKS